MKSLYCSRTTSCAPFSSFIFCMTSGVNFPGMQVVRAGFSDKLQTMTLGVRDEFVEVEGLIDLAQIIVEKGFVYVFEGSLKLCPNCRNVVVRLWCGFRQELQKPACLSHFFGRIIETRRVETHHAADQIAQMVSRVGVIADVCDTLRIEHFPTNCQNALSNRVRNPGVQTVGDDEVESSKSLETCLTDVHRMQADISLDRAPSRED